MSESGFKEEGAPNKSSVQKAVFNDKRDDLFTALDTLYIYGNASGRNKFREKWPDVAAYVFGERLIVFDNEGTNDFELRKELEEEADARRFFLKETITDMYEKSVDSGMLQFDYVGKVVDAFGPNISKFLYSETVIERVRPGLLATGVSEGASESDNDGVSAAEKEALNQPVSEPLDDIQPIDTDSMAIPADDLSVVHDVSIDEKTLDDIVPPESDQDDMQDVADVDAGAAKELLPEISEAGDAQNAKPQDVVSKVRTLGSSPSVEESFEPPEPKVGNEVPLDRIIEEAQSEDAALPPQTDLQSAPLEAPLPQPDEALPQPAEHQAEESQSPEQPEDTPKEQSKESKVDSVSFEGRGSRS